MHSKTAERKEVSQRRQSMYHTELLIHLCKLRVFLCDFLVLGPPDFLPNVVLPLNLVPLPHHLSWEQRKKLPGGGNINNNAYKLVMDTLLWWPKCVHIFEYDEFWVDFLKCSFAQKGYYATETKVKVQHSAKWHNGYNFGITVVMRLPYHQISAKITRYPLKRGFLHLDNKGNIGSVNFKTFTKRAYNESREMWNFVTFA